MTKHSLVLGRPSMGLFQYQKIEKYSELFMDFDKTQLGTCRPYKNSLVY